MKPIISPFSVATMSFVLFSESFFERYFDHFSAPSGESANWFEMRS
jgi:hypothetical protein